MKKGKIAMVMLSKEVEINGKKTKIINIREPFSGELRGLSIHDIAILNVDSIVTLMPRISDLNATHMVNMPPCDLLELGKNAASFLVPGE
jgi:hypothetical protein